MSIPRVGDLCKLQGNVQSPYKNQLVTITGCLRPRTGIDESGKLVSRMLAKVELVKNTSLLLGAGINELQVLIPAEITSGEQKVLDLFKRNDYDKEDLV